MTVRQAMALKLLLKGNKVNLVMEVLTMKEDL